MPGRDGRKMLSARAASPARSTSVMICGGERVGLIRAGEGSGMGKGYARVGELSMAFRGFRRNLLICQFAMIGSQVFANLLNSPLECLRCGLYRIGFDAVRQGGPVVTSLAEAT